MNQDINKKIEKEFWKMLEANQFVKSTNSITDEVEEFPPAIQDMESVVAINGEFDKDAIDQWLSQALLQVREDTLREVGEMIEKMKKINCGCPPFESKHDGQCDDKDHSELNQALSDLLSQIKLQDNKE